MHINRRKFIKAGALGVLSTALVSGIARAAGGEPLSAVGLMSGPDRRENILRALEQVKREVLRAAHGKRLLIKPNVVNFDGAWGADPVLSSTHVEQLEIVIEWFRHLGFRDMVVAESTPNGMAFDGFDAMGYTRLPSKNGLVFKDLNQEGYRVLNINGGAGTVRVSQLVTDDAYFVVSLGKLKTHNNAVATFSGKNIFMGSPMIDVKNLRNSGGRSDKGRMHGESNQDLHDNLFLLAYNGVRPDMAVIDGYEGMEGKGPIWGTSVASHVAVASVDWLAADRVCCELIGIEKRLTRLGLNPELPAYMQYCAQAGLGTFSLDQIDIRGASLNGLCREYELHEDVATMIGMDPLAPAFRTGARQVNPLDVNPQPPVGVCA